MNLQKASMLPIKFLNIQEAADNHAAMKEKIETVLNNFKQKNPEIINFVLCGSSCGIYANYFTKGMVSDVDIIILDKIDVKKLIITEGIDIIMLPFLASDFLERTVNINGINCLSKEDMVINVISSLRKSKLSTMDYLDILMCGLSVEKVKIHLESAINNISDADRYKSDLTNAANVFLKIYTQEHIDKAATKYDLCYSKCLKEQKE